MPDTAERVLAEGHADMISMARYADSSSSSSSGRETCHGSGGTIRTGRPQRLAVDRIVTPRKARTGTGLLYGATEVYLVRSRCPLGAPPSLKCPVRYVRIYGAFSTEEELPIPDAFLCDPICALALFLSVLCLSHGILCSTPQTYHVHIMHRSFLQFMI